MQLSSSTESCGVGAEDDAGVWREKCYKYRAAIQQLKRKVSTDTPNPEVI